MGATNPVMCAGRRRRIAVIAIAAALTVSLTQPDSGWADSATETASSGPVAGFLSYDTPSDGSFSFTDLSVTIVRSGAVAYTGSLYDNVCIDGEGCHPANNPSYGSRSRSIYVRDLDNDGEPEVVVDLRLGGAHDLCYSIFFQYRAPTYSRVPVLFGDPCYKVKPIGPSGELRLVSADEQFEGRFACDGCSGMPLLVYRYEQGHLVDVTRGYPDLLRRDAADWWKAYARRRFEADAGLGMIAPWAADEYLLGRRSATLKTLHKLVRQGYLMPNDPLGIQQGGEAFVRELDSLLQKRGYNGPPRTPCSPMSGGLGKRLVASFKCAAWQQVLAAKCGFEIALGRALKGLKLASGLYDLRKIKKEARPVAKLYNDLMRMKFGRDAPRGFRNGREAWSTFKKATKASDVIHDLNDLRQALAPSDYRTIAQDIGDIVGLKSCVDALLAALE